MPSHVPHRNTKYCLKCILFSDDLRKFVDFTMISDVSPSIFAKHVQFCTRNVIRKFILYPRKNMVLVWQLLNVYHYKESCSYQLILLSLEIGANFCLMIKQMSQLQYTTLTTNWTKFVNIYVHGRKHIIIRDLQMPLLPSDLRWVLLRLTECPCYMWMI